MAQPGRPGQQIAASLLEFPCGTRLFARKAGLLPAFFISGAACEFSSNQAAAFLRVRFTGAGFSGSFGLRPSPIVLANSERAAA